MLSLVTWILVVTNFQNFIKYKLDISRDRENCGFRKCFHPFLQFTNQDTVTILPHHLVDIALHLVDFTDEWLLRVAEIVSP